MTGRLLAALAAAVVLLAGCGSSGSGTSSASSSGSAGRQSPAAVQTDLRPCPRQTGTAAADRALPELTLPCFSGGTLDLAKAPGVPTVVNLWASWCTPCRDELPLLQQLADRAGDRVRVVGVVSKDGVSQATSFAADAQATFPSAYDEDGDLMAGLGIRNLPYTYFLTADGSVAYVQVGPVRSLDQLEQLVDQHLGVRL